jgi:hypothetical protein
MIRNYSSKAVNQDFTPTSHADKNKIQSKRVSKKQDPPIYGAKERSCPESNRGCRNVLIRSESGVITATLHNRR